MKNFRKVFAILLVIALLALYAVTFFLAVTGKATRDVLMACVLCTVLVPGILYAMMLVAKLLGGHSAEDASSADASSSDSSEDASADRNSARSSGKDS